MSASKWIESVKRTSISVVFTEIGMSERKKTWGPCPACGATKRGSEDGRGPVGVNALGGWACHASGCGAKGDTVTALSYHLTRSDSPKDGNWDVIRDFAADRGWCQKGREVTDRVRHVSGSAHAPTPSAPPTVEEDVEPDDGPGYSPSGARRASNPDESSDHGGSADERTSNDRGAFKWSTDLIDRCWSAYQQPAGLIQSGAWSETDVGLAASVVKYLVRYRGLTADVIDFAKLGILVDPDGKLVLSEGRPWLVIPLYDKAGRAVSAHFRRVPVPGTCPDCDALGQWKECDTCRKKKRYRLCSGRPTPLYGANHLTGDTKKPVYIVEGELDVLALRVYGFTDNVVSGTAGADTFVSKQDWLDAIEPYESFYLCYDDDKAGNEGAAALAAKLGADRCSRVRFPRKDVGDCLIQEVPVEQIQRAFHVAESLVEIKFRKASGFIEQIKAITSEPNMGRGTPTGSDILDSAIAGWRPGVIVVTGDTGAGKAQPVDEIVLTPSGFVPIGSIKVGDEVITVTGQPTRVLGVFPQGERDVVKVRFSDGAEVRCDTDHLWTVCLSVLLPPDRRWRTVKASEIPALLVNPLTSRPRRVRVPMLGQEYPRQHGLMPDTKRRIVAVEPAGRAECVCIAVEHPSQLYVTRDYVVTHNTTFLTWALWNLATRGHPVAITSFEQTPAGSVQKVLRMQLGGDYTKVPESELDRAGAELDAMPLYFVDHYGHLPFAKLQESLKYAARRLGIKHILVDHLGFLVDEESEDERRAIEAIVRSMVIVAKNLGITIFLVVHPRNDPDAKSFSRVTMRHLKGASAIRQDADDVLVVTSEPPNTERGRMLPKGKRRPWPQMRLFIDKKRSEFGTIPPGGCIVMAFDPVSLRYADAWADTPLGQAGVLFDTVPETGQEGDGGSASKGGKRKPATGSRKGSRRDRDAEPDDADPFSTDV